MRWHERHQKIGIAYNPLCDECFQAGLKSAPMAERPVRRRRFACRGKPARRTPEHVLRRRMEEEALVARNNLEGAGI